MFKRNYFLFSLFLFTYFSVFAQFQSHNQLGKHLSYELSFEGFSDLAYLSKYSTLDVYIIDSVSKMDLVVLNGLASFGFIQRKGSEHIQLLMDIPAFMDKKIVDYEHSNDLFGQMTNYSMVNRAPRQAPEIKIFRKRKKRIEGMLCDYIEIHSRESHATMKIYYTEKIKSKIFSGFNEVFEKVNGLPLSIELCYQDINFSLKVRNIKKKQFEKDFFEKPDDYTKMSEVDFIVDFRQKMLEEQNKTASRI